MTDIQQEESSSLITAYEKKVRLLLVLVSLLTILDALASWISISYMGIAEEGDKGLDAIAQLVGFEGAMVIRVAWGVGLSAVLALLAIRFKKESRRKLAYRGLWFIAIALLLLFAYHIVVLSVGFVALFSGM